MMITHTGDIREFNRLQVAMDIVVVGAGPAGLSAAIAAARQGAQVALVTDRPVLGGSASSEVRVGPGGAANIRFNRFARETGLIQEMFLELRHRAQGAGKWRWFNFDELYFDLVLREPNIRLFLNTTVRACETRSGAIFRCTATQLRSETEIEFQAKYFIDCSGDGTLGFLAGAHSRMGREAKSEFGEALAPEVADDQTMGATLLFTSKIATHPVKWQAPPWAIKITELPSLIEPEKSIHRGMGKMPDGTFYGFWWVEYGGHLDSIHDDNEITLHLRRLVYGIWDHIKNSGKFAGVEAHDINWVGYLPGKRETRRLMGPYLATANDFLQQKPFDDAIGHCGWALDIHPPKGYLDEEPACVHTNLPGVSDIPFRILYSRNISNLLFAGRDVSCTHQALGTLRLIMTTAVMGQAVGTAAQLCLERGITPAALSEQAMPELQRRLMRRDQSLIGRTLMEPEDLSRKAKVAASSVCPAEMTEPDNLHLLSERYGMILPIMTPEVTHLRFWLKATRPEKVTLRFFENDGKPENYRWCGEFDQVTVDIAADGWASFPVNLAKSVQGVARGKKLLVAFDPNEHVFIRSAQEALPGVLCVKFARKNELPAYETPYDDVPFLPCFQIDPPQALFRADHVNDGHIRPHGLPHLWVSKKIENREPAWIRLDFASTEKISRVELVFNSDLDDHGLKPDLRTVSDGLARTYELRCSSPGQPERRLLFVEENHQRFAIHVFEPVEASAVTLLVHESWGSRRAEVFDFRVYR
jgi:hypothetical protein